MLTAAQVAQGRTSRRPVPSLRQQYNEYILQRIDAYKNSLPREKMLALGDDASHELHAGSSGQFVLTEILMEETVDKLIAKRLRLPSYNKWRKQYAALREAQREPIHWGIDPANVLVGLLPRLEAGDHVLAVGGGVQAEVCLLSAFDLAVTFVDGDPGLVEQLEARLAEESLSLRFDAKVAVLGNWLPRIVPAAGLVVIDAGTLAGIPYARRQALLAQAREATAPGGVHVLLPGGGGAPEAYLSHYSDWERERGRPGPRGKGRSKGLVLCRPPEPEPESARQTEAS